MLKLHPSSNAIRTTLTFCDFHEEDQVEADLIDDLWSDLKVLEYKWEGEVGKFTLME